MKTLTELLIALSSIRNQVNSTDIPILIDGKEIDSVVFDTKSELKVKISTKNE